MLKKTLKYIPVISLVLVAGFQVGLKHYFKELDQWKLGGFGMFSNFSKRIIVYTGKVSGEYREKEIVIDFNDSDENILNEFFLNKLRAFPSNNMLSEALSILSERKYINNGNTLLMVANSSGVFRSNKTTIGKVSLSKREELVGYRMLEYIRVKVYEAKYNNIEKKIKYALLREKVQKF